MNAEKHNPDKRLLLDRRIAGDRRFGTNPKGYYGPERRSVFDRRSHNERRHKRTVS